MNQRPAVFINYSRRHDGAEARLLKDFLSRRWNESAVFLDVTAIHGAVLFPTEILEALSSCSAVIVIIGPDWINRFATELLENNQVQLDIYEKDWLKEEILYALTTDTPILPVLVKGAKMPEARILPKEFRKITLYQALRMSHEDFPSDALKIAENIEQTVLQHHHGWRSYLYRFWVSINDIVKKIAIFTLLGSIVGVIVFYLFK